MANLEGIIKAAAKVIAAAALAATVSCGNPQEKVYVAASYFADGMQAYQQQDYKMASKLLMKSYIMNKRNPIVAIDYARSMEKEYEGYYNWFATYTRLQAHNLLEDSIKKNSHNWKMKIHWRKKGEAANAWQEYYDYVELQTANLNELKEYCGRYQKNEWCYKASYELQQDEARFAELENLWKEIEQKNE